MNNRSDSLFPAALWASVIAYTLATSAHFVHNGLFLSAYPNMPEWISESGVYGTLCGIVLLGGTGVLLYLRGWQLLGLVLLVGYAALGFDGLLHYTLAPLSAHSLAMNATILSEVFAAALLFICGLWGLLRIWRA